MEEAGLPCNPTACMMDFEAAAWNAIRHCFPQASLNGCGFHWAKCVRAKWAKLGLPTAAGNDANLRTIYARVLAHRFFPEQDIPETFKRIKTSVVGLRYPAEHPVHQFIRYVESQWVSSITFPPKSWSQNGLEIRTNNDVEGWHRGFNSGQPRPVFYTFMTKVYDSLEDTRMLMQTGQHRRRNDAAVTQKNAALQAILAQLDNMPEGRGISHVLDDIAQLFDYESGAAI